MAARQIILDTETTGLNARLGDRVIEIGCIELLSRRVTERHFHSYLNPEHEIDEGAAKVHGLTAEFLGDYVYAAATNDAAVAVWNDARNAGVCTAINSYRASLYTASPSPAPDVVTACPPKFGNSDIFGGRYADPTP